MVTTTTREREEGRDFWRSGPRRFVGCVDGQAHSERAAHLERNCASNGMALSARGAGGRVRVRWASASAAGECECGGAHVVVHLHLHVHCAGRRVCEQAGGCVSRAPVRWAAQRQRTLERAVVDLVLERLLLLVEHHADLVGRALRARGRDLGGQLGLERSLPSKGTGVRVGTEMAHVRAACCRCEPWPQP